MSNMNYSSSTGASTNDLAALLLELQHSPADAALVTTCSDSLFGKSEDCLVLAESMSHFDAAAVASASAITLGICCMAKKLRSQTMQRMLERFTDVHCFTVVPFNEALIVVAPVQAWPRVDVMIAFHSTGFPIEKAILYSQLYPHTYYLTHPESQPVLLDRRDVLAALARNNIPVARSIWCTRDGHNGSPMPAVTEGPDHIVVNGQRMDKPFVEKPVNSEDHNIYIYHKGGGCSQLFRKKENSCSNFHQEISAVRADGGSYIYEEFLETNNMMDVKCYTVGPHFVFAEERKAPVVDGIVERDECGKELRNTSCLTVDEQMVARKVIKVFRQMVCGFDILRSHGKFYVCDVNGWSFVKNNSAYVVRATDIMAEIFRLEVLKRGLHRVAPPCPGEGRTLLGFVGVFRHADRTPKQKVKLVVTLGALLEVVFQNNHRGASQSGSSNSDDEQKKKKEQEKGKAAAAAAEHHTSGDAGGAAEAPTTASALSAASTGGDVLEELVFKTGHPKLQVIQRTCEQMLEELVSSTSGSDEMDSTSPQGAFGVARVGDGRSRSVAKSLQTIIDVLTRQHEGLKIQVKPIKTKKETIEEVVILDSDDPGAHQQQQDGPECDDDPRPEAKTVQTTTTTRVVTTVTEAMFICKWGGWLTAAGEKQSEMLGQNFVRRVLGVESTDQCLKVSEMNVRTNTERRVINTGTIFAKALLCGNDPENGTIVVDEKLLGSTATAKVELGEAQRHIASLLHTEDPAAIARLVAVTPGLSAVLSCPVLEDADRTPLGTLRTLHRLVCNVAAFIPRTTTHLYGNEPLDLLIQRWENLATSFIHPRSGRYDVSKIADICDYVSYDVCYNQESLAPLDLFPLYTLSEVLGALVACAEFGATNADKKRTAALIASPLISRIRTDIIGGIAKGHSPRTRMYFTSESHIMALKNLLYMTTNAKFHILDACEPLELNFLSHLVFKVYQYHQTERIMIEVHFSSGIEKNMFGIVQEHHVQYGAVTPMIRIHNALSVGALDKIALEYEALSKEIRGGAVVV